MPDWILAMFDFAALTFYLVAVLLSIPGVSTACLEKTTLVEDCVNPFQAWHNGSTFWTDICSSQGRLVFACLDKYYGENCTVYDQNNLDLFTSLFRPLSYDIDYACEYYHSDVCRQIVSCFDSVSKYTGTTVYQFYEYFCGSKYLQYMFECIESKRTECPATAQVWSAVLTYTTASGTITYTDVLQKTALECPKLTATDVQCLSSNDSIIMAQCQTNPVIDMPKLTLDCSHSSQTKQCISDKCGSNLATFFEEMFTFLQCSTIEILSEWTDWSECSVTCGLGVQLRTRTCLVKECSDSLVEVNGCVIQCPVDGGYGQWVPWSSCNTSCGEGTQTRFRLCNNPAPANGGQDCVGEKSQTQTCQLAECPVNGGFSAWGGWSKCTLTCGSGSQTRTRACDNPPPANGGADCVGGLEETTSCTYPLCPVNGGFSAWSTWSECTVTCGSGSQNRTRSCDNPAPSNGGTDCVGDSTETIPCSALRLCPVNGGFSAWSVWSKCSVTCGAGSRTRTRSCDSPAPASGGADCVGDLSETSSCIDQAQCPVTVCPATSDIYGDWPRTLVGQTSSIPCINKHHIGNYSRQCKYNGIWDTVFDQCRLNDTLLQDLANKVEDLLNTTSIVSEEEIDKVSESLTNLTASINYETDGQLFDNVLGIINGITSVIQRTGNVSDQSIESITEAVSNIIRPESEDAWSKNSTTALGSEVLGTVDNLYAAFLDVRCPTLQDGAVKAISTENIYTEIGAVTGDVRFPTGTNTGASINVSTSTLLNKGITDTCFGGTFYKSVSSKIERAYLNGSFREVGSDVIAVQLQHSPRVVLTDLDPPVRIALTLKNTTAGKVVCVFWDYNKTNISQNGAWSAEGCVLVNVTNSTAVCECNHLTNFAILMSPYKIPDEHTKVLGIISAIGCAISMVCLILTIVAHCVVWRLVRSDRAVILMNLCVALLLALGFFLVGVNRTESREACAAIAALIQILFLAVFAFIFLIGLEILLSVVHVFVTKFRIKILIPVAWLIPVVIVAVSLAVTKTKGYGNDQFCWLDVESGLIWSFVGPVAFVILVNCVVIIIVFKKMSSSSLLKSKTKAEQTRTVLRSLCVLMPVLGLTWILGILSVNSSMIVVQYLFAIFNSLQGLLIFLFHCVFNTQIRSAMRRRRERKKSLETFSSDLRKQSRSRNSSKDEQLNYSSSEHSQEKSGKANRTRSKSLGEIADGRERQRLHKYQRDRRLLSLSSGGLPT